jgi:ligand-binding SRPBCC domain-containing protein
MRDQRVTIHRQTDLDAPAERVWQAILQPNTMLYVLKGLFSFPALNGRIDPISQGEVGSGWTLLFHVIPFTRWTIKVVRVDPDAKVIVTNEHGGMIRCWNHTLHVEERDTTHSRYTDSIEVDAGPLTRIIAACVGFIFSYRQHRLRRLARSWG